LTFSRRDLSVLLPTLLASGAKGQSTSSLPSKVYPHGAIAYSGNEQKKGRRFFFGNNRSGFRLEMHETILGAGIETHPPHRHLHEEIVIVTEGTVEATIDDRTEVAQAGSVIYFGSNQMHNARNIGTTPSRYYVIELRGDEA
jgi:quercetin dioxygenase-like cupin family protein